MTLELLVVNPLHVRDAEIPRHLFKTAPTSGSLEAVDFKDKAPIYLGREEA